MDETGPGSLGRGPVQQGSIESTPLAPSWLLQAGEKVQERLHLGNGGAAAHNDSSRSSSTEVVCGFSSKLAVMLSKWLNASVLIIISD